MPKTDSHMNTAAIIDPIIDRLGAGKLVHVIVLDRAEDAPPLAESLIEGGLPVAEITMRTPAALDAMKAMAKHPEILLGAGTVCTADQVNQAVDCGAQYIICPGLHE